MSLFDRYNKTRIGKHFRSTHLEHIDTNNQKWLLPNCVQCGSYKKKANTEEHLNSEECKKCTEIINNKRLD